MYVLGTIMRKIRNWRLSEVFVLCILYGTYSSYCTAQNCSLLGRRYVLTVLKYSSM
jgi:hypothetical protein